MKKSFSFFALSLISLVFFSCSSFLDSSSKTKISLSLPSKTIRAITDEENGTWTLKINLSGDSNQEKSFLLQENALQEVQTFTFEDLQIGQNLKVDVNIYLDDVRKYKSQQEYFLTLEKEENLLDVVLVRDNASSNISIKSDIEIIATFVVDGETKTYSNSQDSSDSQNEIILIPYSVEQINFTLADSNLTSVTWSLNGKEISRSAVSVSIVPSQSDYVLLSSSSDVLEKDVNVISCNFGSIIQQYYSEFKFYLVDDFSDSAEDSDNSDSSEDSASEN